MVSPNGPTENRHDDRHDGSQIEGQRIGKSSDRLEPIPLTVELLDEIQLAVRNNNLEEAGRLIDCSAQEVSEKVEPVLQTALTGAIALYHYKIGAANKTDDERAALQQAYDGAMGIWKQNGTARDVLATIVSSHEQHRNDALLTEILNEARQHRPLMRNLGLLNSLALLALKSSYPNQPDMEDGLKAELGELMPQLLRYYGPTTPNRVLGHIHHNFGRYVLGEGDPATALKYLQSAKELYRATDRADWIHLAALHHWTSEAHLGIGERSQAIIDQRLAVTFYEMQYKMNSQAYGVDSKLATARNDLARLEN